MGLIPLEFRLSLDFSGIALAISSSQALFYNYFANVHFIMYLCDHTIAPDKEI